MLCKKGNGHNFFGEKKGETTIVKRIEERRRRGRVLSIIPPNYGRLFFPVENHSSSSFTHVLRGETWKRSAASKQYKNKVKSYDMEEVDSRVYISREEEIVSKRKVCLCIESVSPLSTLFFLSFL